MKNHSDIQIRAGWMIDGSGAAIIKNPIINIANNKIASIGGEESLSPHTDNQIDYSGCTIIPGLIDSHVHLAVSGSINKSDRKSQLDLPYEVIKRRIEGHIRDHFKHGILAVRDGGDRGRNVLRFKSDSHSMDLPVYIATAGNAWHGSGRYGSFLGRSPEMGMEPADSILNEYVDGIDHIKIINSGLISLSNYGKETSPHFTTDELKKIVDVAQSLGLTVMVHANGNKPVESAIEAGCNSIEHGFFMGDDNLKRMADKRIVWIPTVNTMEAIKEMYPSGSREYEIASKNLDHQISQVEKAIGYGVSIAVGTDSGSPGVIHGYSIIREMKLLMSGGLSVEKIIEAGSHTGSRLFKNVSVQVLLKKNEPATFLVVNGTPQHLPEALDSLEAIWISGIIKKK
jgi:imidazolonepropionase-like amidohydrolase